jgi:hypothetical protein
MKFYVHPLDEKQVTGISLLTLIREMSQTQFCCQVKDRGEGAPRWLPLALSAFQLKFRSLFCGSDVRHQLAKIRRFFTLGVVTLTHFGQYRLNLMTIVRAIKVVEVKQQPNLEARVGKSYINIAATASFQRIRNPRVFIAIEYRPHLITFLKR